MVLLAGFTCYADHDFLSLLIHVTEAIPGHDIVEVLLLLLLNFTLCHLFFLFEINYQLIREVRINKYLIKFHGAFVVYKNG